MTPVKFSTRAVAFLDILGFKELVKAAHESEAGRRRLSRLMRKLLSNAPLNRLVNPTAPVRLHPRSIEISDSIVLSTPLTHPDYSWYQGLQIVIMRCSQIASILLEEGYLLTGAINVGPMQHTPRNVIGVAYQDAFARQSTVCSPAIVLSPEAAREWQIQSLEKQYSPSTACLRRTVTFRTKDEEGRPTAEQREATIVNVFEPTYMNSVRALARRGPPPVMDDAWLSDCMARIQATIAENLARFAQGTPTHQSSVLSKWRWFSALYEDHGKAGIEHHLTMRPELIKWATPGT